MYLQTHILLTLYQPHDAIWRKRELVHFGWLPREGGGDWGDAFGPGAKTGEKAKEKVAGFQACLPPKLSATGGSGKGCDPPFWGLEGGLPPPEVLRLWEDPGVPRRNLAGS